MPLAYMVFHLPIAVCKDPFEQGLIFETSLSISARLQFDRMSYLFGLTASVVDRPTKRLYRLYRYNCDTATKTQAVSVQLYSTYI